MVHCHWKKVIPEQRGKVAALMPDKTSLGSQNLLFILMLLVSLNFFNESARYSLKREFLLCLALYK